jgi:hypothetical protein
MCWVQSTKLVHISLGYAMGGKLGGKLVELLKLNIIKFPHFLYNDFVALLEVEREISEFRKAGLGCSSYLVVTYLVLNNCAQISK